MQDQMQGPRTKVYCVASAASVYGVCGEFVWPVGPLEKTRSLLPPSPCTHEAGSPRCLKPRVVNCLESALSQAPSSTASPCFSRGGGLHRNTLGEQRSRHGRLPLSHLQQLKVPGQLWSLGHASHWAT